MDDDCCEAADIDDSKLDCIAADIDDVKFGEDTVEGPAPIGFGVVEGLLELNVKEFVIPDDSDAGDCVDALNQVVTLPGALVVSGIGPERAVVEKLAELDAKFKVPGLFNAVLGMIVYGDELRDVIMIFDAGRFVEDRNPDSATA